MKQTILLIAFILGLYSSSLLFGQDETDTKDSPLSLSCDLMSRYIWRGTDFGASPSIQPGIEYSNSGVTVGAWGAYATNLPGVQEADLYLGYSINDMFSVTMTDYFFPDEINAYKYFDYANKTTGHVFEVSASFLGTKKLPLTVLLASNIYGADAQKFSSDSTAYKIQYSSYAEFTYSFKRADIFMGFNLSTPDKSKGETGYYGDTFGVVNLGITSTKEIKISDSYNLPLSVSLITNPQAQKIYLVAGFSF